MSQAWPAISRDGLIVTGGYAIALGLMSVVGSMTAQPDLSRLLIAGGVGLIMAGTALVARVGRRFATAMITGLSGGAFALVLADITSMPIDAPDRYESLRYVVVLAAILIALITFEDGFRSSKSPRVD
jgi:hypothetical protein